MIDLTGYQDLPIQGTVDWMLLRLGKFNGSRISELMGKGKKKDEYWSKTALSYISEVASERALSKEVLEDEDMVLNYFDLVSVENRYMRYGSEHENDARETYELRHNVKVTQVSSICHADAPSLACSSDGLVLSTNSGIEIKCPLPKTYWQYRTEIHDAETLKAVKPEYYWQVMSQIAVCDLDYVDFVAWCEFMEKPMHEVRVMRDDEAISQLLERIVNADKYIEEKWNL